MKNDEYSSAGTNVGKFNDLFSMEKYFIFSEIFVPDSDVAGFCEVSF